MEQLLSKIWNSRFGKYLLPLSFCIGQLINFMFYYLGLAFQENIARQTGFVIGNVLFTVAAFLALLSALRFGGMRLKTLLPLTAVLLFFAGGYLIALLRVGFTGLWIHNAGQFVFFAFPAFCAGVYAVRKRQEQTFFDILERFGLLAVPAALIYLNGALFNCNPFNWGRNLGILNYMTFSYTLMPFLLAMVFQFLEAKPFTLFGRVMTHPQRIRLAIISLYWLAIIAAGTRGTYFCVVGFCICLTCSAFLRRDSRRRSSILSAAMTFVLCFNIFVYAPAGFGTSRMTVFLQGLSKGEILTTTEDPAVSEKLDDLVKADGNEQITNREEPEPSPDNIEEENLQIKSRGTLFKLAIKEFQASPLTGMGPMKYSVKYGLYPHNIPLELLCETGILGSFFLMSLILWAVVRLLRRGWKERETRYFLLFMIAYAIEANISGGLWDCSPLLCALAYSFALPDKENSCDSPAKSSPKEPDRP